jgi:hypothetical protein
MADVNVIPYGDGAGHKIHKSLVKTDRKALAFTSGVTVLSFTLRAWARAKMIVLEMPTFSGAVVTGTVSVENSDSKEIYSRGDMVENETHVRTVDFPIVGTNTVKVTLSTDPHSSGTCYLTIYLEGGD